MKVRDIYTIFITDLIMVLCKVSLKNIFFKYQSNIMWNNVKKPWLDKFYHKVTYDYRKLIKQLNF